MMLLGGRTRLSAGRATSSSCRSPQSASTRCWPSFPWRNFENCALSVAEAIHQRFLLAAVNLDRRAVDEMRQIRSQVGDETGHLFAFGNAPKRNAARS